MRSFLKFVTILILVLNFTLYLGNNIVKANENTTSVQQMDRLKKIKKSGVLTVLSANMAPYSYKDPINGEFSGLDADIIKEIAYRLGVNNVNAQYIAFPSLLEEGINNPQIDSIAQGLYITDERKKLMNFTNPIYTERDVILTRKDTNINNKDDLKNKIIGVVAGSFNDNIANNWKQQGLISDYIRFYDSNSLLLALENKIIDAVVTSSILGENALLQRPNSNFKLLSPIQYKSEATFNVGYALKKEDITLLNAINEALQEMKTDGTLYGILAKRSLTSHYIP
ncbi:substrate-binding periplasmic protein [Inconstantimicrobium mannanitabidum]|uniref:Amino acid ABC transporter substrate-binding protein n=1 Tax=Inconstantimicrobium mannanitabidum TaxID=1604901 RepID=A0ACB5RHN9_9CLOT|nr:ABC transporter substrate-binding protein [Clostridium sp. TW13]GKX68598.1 amino acid ABC transporter substrate-binding protein [Clostridium sp. TW13]